jgi:hypothetical protein
MVLKPNDIEYFTKCVVIVIVHYRLFCIKQSKSIDKIYITKTYKILYTTRKTKWELNMLINIRILLKV